MGRPRKIGLDYMSLDCDTFSNRKIRLFRADFATDHLAAWGVLVLLWLRIYGGKGAYLLWDDDEKALFCEDTGAAPELVCKVISRAVVRGIFDRQIFEAQQVLTSDEIKYRYEFATADRRRYGATVDKMDEIIVRRKSTDIGGFYAEKVHKEKKRKEKKTKLTPKTCKKHGPISGDFCRECVAEEREGKT
jgi:hypothetical protein